MRIVRNAVLAFLLAAPLVAGEHRLHTFPSTTPDSLWSALMEGNRRYVDGSIAYRSLRERREATHASQSPPITILSCADSRVPPELIFDHTVGDLFVVRVAGNVTDAFALASLEFAVANGYTRLIVVIGHEACGAVKAALNTSDPGTPALQALVSRIRESLEGVDPANLRAAVEANARFTADGLVKRSDVIRKAVEQGKVRIVPAYYAFDGTVTRLDDR